MTGHIVLIVAAVMVSVLPGCRHPPPPDLSSFDNVDITHLDSTDKLEHKQPRHDDVPPPPPPPPTELRDPEVPPDPVPVRPTPPVLPKPPERDRDPEGVIPDRTPPHDKPKPVSSNAAPRAANTPVPVVKTGVHVTRIVTAAGPRHPMAMRPLTASELDPLGNIDAPLGKSNSVPMDERQQCLLRIKKALYDVWDRPTLADAGRQSALLEIGFDQSGRVVSSAIAQSSGSTMMDRTVLLAAKGVTRVEGLTPGFLKEYSKLTVEFTVTE